MTAIGLLGLSSSVVYQETQLQIFMEHLDLDDKIVLSTTDYTGYLLNRVDVCVDISCALSGTLTVTQVDNYDPTGGLTSFRYTVRAQSYKGDAAWSVVVWDSTK